MPGLRGAAAIHSLLESHGFVVQGNVRAFSEDELSSAIADGPLLPSLLVTLAGASVFEGLSLLERAAILQAPRASRIPSDAAPVRRRRKSAAGARGVENAFSLIFRALGEERAGQLDMALAVWGVLEEGGIALLEAGTGTGKSLAYLVPCILFSRETGERVVFSTYTRNLQEQLFRKEVPLLADILKIDVEAERLMGRENYLCSRNMSSAVRKVAEKDPRRALALALFLSLSACETLDSFEGFPNGFDERALTAPARCPMNGCGFAERCPLIRARKRARESKLLFVNHALVLTDYRQGRAVIGPYERIVFDEAHNLERCVVENLSVKVGRDDLRRVLEPLKLGERQDETWKFVIRELEREGRAGKPTHYRQDLAKKAKKLESALAQIFGCAANNLNATGDIRSARTRYIDGEETFASVSDAISDFLLKINEFGELLKPICEASFPSDLSPFQQEVSFALEELSTLSEALKFLAKGADEESVFWLDWASDASLREMCGSPMSVDRPFADYLETVLGSAVFTSATLSQDGGFGFIKDRLGLRLLGTKPVELIIPSPFPFDEHCLILIVSGLGDPNEGRFAGEVGEIVRGLDREVGRRTMVLFTSYRLCRATSEYLDRFALTGPILVQGAGESREMLSARFRRSPAGILFGVASFWEGVDFPGEELEVLVIPKIPFPVPTEPIVEARAQRLMSLGEDAFEKLFLPEAVLRMRQGAGRLIRRLDDRGVIIILDSRLESRPYAAAVLQSLPSKNVHHVSAAECVARAAEWFSRS